MRILDLDVSPANISDERLHEILDEQSKIDPEQLDKVTDQFPVKRLKDFIRYKVGSHRMSNFKKEHGFSQSRRGVTDAIYFLYATATGRGVAKAKKPAPKPEPKKDNWKSGPIYDGETVLDDSFPVHAGYYYVVDGRAIESMVSGTVRHLKADIQRYHNHEVSEVRRCDLSARITARRGSGAM